ncbi:Calx-beta domain-containing protein, partial [Microcystis sp. M18BS1]|uniref:Calx-beta domain-containing protein n=1 Tax=Microcystis sp. M18BS1 TaxID=2771179 RepID=UPI00258A283D
TGSFGPATNFSVVSRPTSVTVGDFNGDGKSDLATGDYFGNSVSVLLGTGTGSFGPATNFSVVSRPTSVTVGDFNGDGKSDLATAKTVASRNVSVLLGTGTGSFGTASNFSVGSFPYSVTAGDFNGDGKLDLATANSYGSNVSVLLGTGTGSFATATNFTVGSFPRSVTVGDFNGDGKSDLATANPSNGGSISILLNADPTATVTITDVPPPPIALSINDVTVTEGDSGTTNAVFTVSLSSAASTVVSVNYATANGTATAGTDYTAIPTTTLTFNPGETSKTITVAVNGDNQVELNETFFLNLSNLQGNGSNVTLADNQGQGTINNDDSASIAISDVTITEGNSGTTNAVFTVTLSNPVDTAITLNYATADGTATTADNDYTAINLTPLTFNAGETSKTITVAVNGDTKVESNETFFVNLSNLQTNGRNVTIADNQGQGTINNDDIAPPKITIAPGTNPVEGGTVGTFIITLDTPAPTGGIVVNFNTTGSTATNIADYSLTAGTNITAVTANTFTIAAGATTATLNVVAVSDAVNDPNETVKVNLTSGGDYILTSFNPATNFTVGSYPFSLTVGDFNSDGKSDLAVANLLYSNNVSVLLGTGTGSFGTATNFSVGSSPCSVTVGDFNSDGKSDLAVANADSNNVSVLLGTGTGSFGPATNFSVGISPRSVTVGDFNGDGKSDLAVANSGSTVSVLLGTGTGSFGTATNFTVGSVPTSVTVGDFNGDGKSDLAVANALSSNVSVLLGTGTGSFGTPSNFTVGTNPNSVTVGDFNSDGKSDLATANPSNGGSISIFLNADPTATVTITDVSQPPISLTINDVTVTEGNSGTTNAVFTVSLSSAASTVVSVDYATANGTATAGTDYTAIPPTTLTFNPGETSKTITVAVNGDNQVELNETFFLNLSNLQANGSNVTLADNQGQGTINNDDSASIAITDVTITEGNSGTTNAVFTVTLSNPVDTAITLNYATADGTATTADNDYTAIATTPLTFNAGETSKAITVAVNGDNQVESNETFFVNLSSLNANGRNVTIADNQGQGTITNDDLILPSITLAVSPSSVTEDGTTNLTYTFTRSGVTTDALTVNYTVGGTATNGTDYASIPTSVTFAANSAIATVTVDPTADTTVESDETVVLTLASGTGYTIGTTTPVTGTITNGPVTPSITLAVAPSSVTEDGTSNLVYTFTRSGVTSNALTVNYTLGGTATLNTDYTRSGTNNTVTFAANATTATVIVAPTADTTVESNETVALTLASGTGYTIGTPNAATGTITNDDTSVTLAVSPASVTENGTTNLIYTFTRTGVTTSALTANYTVGGTATFNTDYTQTGAASFTSTTGTVTFAANATKATVTVDPTADTTVESNETVVLTLATGTGYTIGTPTAVTGTINNDDTNVTLAVSPGSVTEDGTNNLVYTFTRSGVIANALTVNYTLGGTATLNTDYTRTGTNNTVTFAANATTATVTVDPTADTTVESDETVALTLASGTGYTVGTTTAVTGTITNDDFSQLSINDIITVVEGKNSNAVLTVTVDNPNPQQISVNYATAPIDATANVDYTSQTGTLIIPANASTATITIPILNDDLNEPDEVFAVTLSNATNAIINPDEETAGVIITDTWQSILTRTLPNGVENLKLIGTNNINGTGNNANNIITGNSGNNQINGANGADILTGGLGADTFIFQFGQSTTSASDRITDFAINSDKIDLLTQGGLPMSAPSSFSRAANSTVTTLQNLINQVFTDANGATTGNQGLGVNSAALVQVTTGAIAGTYLVINDSTAGFQSSNDLLINITGFTGTLPALGNIPVGNFFV